MNKTALITGINGMDGSHLADLLLTKGYKVYGMERFSSSINDVNTKHIRNEITILNGDMTDQNSLLRCLKESNPDEVYNLAEQSFVGESWNTPEHTSDVTGLGVLRILEAIREFNPVTSLVCSGVFQLSPTNDCAAKLYTSSGLLSLRHLNNEF
jgi:GDPmannose 4,6-dehydratase